MTRFSNRIPQLLISIRDESEAQALRGFIIDIVDLKEPDHGPLGRPSDIKIEAILHQLETEQPVSLAMGELRELVELPDAQLFQRIHFVKVGLAGLASEPRWQHRWLDWVNRLPSHVTPVGVFYVDQSRAKCPALPEIIELLGQFPGSPLLLDTFDKRMGSSLDLLGDVGYRKIISQLKQQQIRLVLAGSLKIEDLARLRGSLPDVIGVRGAVCIEGRAKLCPHKLTEFYSRFLQAAEQFDPRQVVSRPL